MLQVLQSVPSCPTMVEKELRNTDSAGRKPAAAHAAGASESDPRPGNEIRPGSRWQSPRFLTLLLLVVLSFLALTLVYLKDEPPPWEVDLLRPVFTEQAQDMSAPSRMKTMLAAAAKVPNNSPVFAAPWHVGIEQLGALLETNSTVLDNLNDLLEEKQEEWEPRSLLWKIEDFGADAAWQNVVRLKEAEAVHLARRGQEEAAFLSATDLVVLGSLLERLDSWPSFMDRALEIHEHGTIMLARLLARTQLSDAKLKRLQEQEFKPWNMSVERLNEAMNGFYSFERKLLLGAPEGEPPLPAGYLPARSGSRFFFKPLATLRLFAESFHELKKDTTQTAFAHNDQIESRLQHRVQSAGLFGSSNRSGVDYFATRIRIYTPLSDRNALERARHAVVLALFGVRRFIQQESRLPRRLEELVPKFLSSLPLDPFSGEPIRYNPVNGLIYSVGMNLKDEGGKPTVVPLSDPDEPTAQIGVGVAGTAQ